jgi:hypothetical protein
MEAVVTFDKVSHLSFDTKQMPLLIYDLLLTEIWKEKVYDQIKDKIPQTNSIKQYMAVSNFGALIKSRFTTKLQFAISWRFFCTIDRHVKRQMTH